MKIISGAQTGADIAGLMAAKKLGLPTGGWMPLGFKTLDGKHPEYAKLYNIKEAASPYYPARTAMNVRDSDGTIRFFTNANSPGELLTLKMIGQYRKPNIDVDYNNYGKRSFNGIYELHQWIDVHGIKTLNISGNSNQTSPGIGGLVYDYLLRGLKKYAV